MKRRKPVQPRTKGGPARFAFPGLWRDGKFLVIDLAEHHFPRRCVKTNQVVEPPFETIALTCHAPAYAEWKLLEADPQRFAQTKFEVITGHKQRTRIQFELPLPLTPRWQAMLRSKWGTRLVWLGAALLLSTYLGWMLFHNTFTWGWIPQVSLVVALALLAVGGGWQLVLRWTLTVEKLFDGKIWVAGVHADWLRQLPQFVPSKRMLTEDIQLLTWSFWTCVTVGLLFLGLMLGGIANGTLSKKEDRSTGLAFLTAAAVVLLIGNRARMELANRQKQLAELYPVHERRRRR